MTGRGRGSGQRPRLRSYGGRTRVGREGPTQDDVFFWFRSMNTDKLKMVNPYTKRENDFGPL